MESISSQSLKKKKLRKYAKCGIVGFLGVSSVVQYFDRSLFYTIGSAYLPEIIETNATKFKIDGDEMYLTEVELETYLNCDIRGSFHQGTLQEVINAMEVLHDDKSKLCDSLDTISLTPSWIKTGYAGRCYHANLIELTQRTSKSIVIHELAHAYSRKLDESFWSEWEAISHGLYKQNDHLFFNGILSELKENVFDTSSSSSSSFTFSSGFLTDYGSLNSHEDLAVFVESSYLLESGPLTRVPLAMRDIYDQKLDLLSEYGFISKKRAKLAKDAIGSENKQ